MTGGNPGELPCGSDPGYRPAALRRAQSFSDRRPPILQHHDKSILVVDDDASARKLVVRLLAEAGYAVIDAPSAQRALDIAEAEGAAVRLLLTDVRMPKMDGIELARRFTSIRPDAGVLLMSGFHDHGPVAHPLLAKPFTGDELVTAVSSLLA